MNIFYSLYPLPFFLSLKNFLSSSASLSLNLLTFIFTSIKHIPLLYLSNVSLSSLTLFSLTLFFTLTPTSLSVSFSLYQPFIFPSLYYIYFSHSQLLYWAATDRKRKVKETLNHCRKPQLCPPEISSWH